MDLSGRGARISQRDIRDLSDASDALAMVANLVKRSRPTWHDDGLALLIKANETIVRVMNKGGAALARYIEKHAPQKPQEAPIDPGTAEAAASTENTHQEGNGE